MVNKGDKVTIDGKTAKITGWYGAGKHRVFQLDDGRTVFDLHLLLEEGDAEVEEETQHDEIVHPHATKEELLGPDAEHPATTEWDGEWGDIEDAEKD